MSVARLTMKDDWAQAVAAGDTVTFSYGIPPVRVEAMLVEIDGELWAMTPGHRPDRCRLRDLRGHVGSFYKLAPPRIAPDTDPSARWDRRDGATREPCP